MADMKEKLASYTNVMAFCSIGLFAIIPFSGFANLGGNSDVLVATSEVVTEATMDDNKERARKFYEIWNAHNPDALDSVIAKNYKMHSKLPGVSQDREGMKQWVASVIAAFPDIHFTVEQQIAEGDLVMTRWSATGTHKGTLMGMPATGKKTRVTGISVVKLKNGKSVASWGEWDAMGMMRQIGPGGSN